jgi:hypothetical protein
LYYETAEGRRLQRMDYAIPSDANAAAAKRERESKAHPERAS